MALLVAFPQFPPILSTAFPPEYNDLKEDCSSPKTIAKNESSFSSSFSYKGGHGNEGENNLLSSGEEVHGQTTPSLCPPSFSLFTF